VQRLKEESKGKQKKKRREERKEKKKAVKGPTEEGRKLPLHAVPFDYGTLSERERKRIQEQGARWEKETAAARERRSVATWPQKKTAVAMEAAPKNIS
jgi:hypothetical protein